MRRRVSARCSPLRRRRGVLLLLVLIAVALLTIANLAYYDWTFSEHRATHAAARAAETLAAAESGVEYVRAFVQNSRSAIDLDGGWYDNPNRFAGVLLTDAAAPEERLRVSIVSPRWTTERIEGFRFGLEDESGRLNLNLLLAAEARQENGGRGLLMALPGMTEATAESILDWIDGDDDARPQGAEASYYSAQTPPYEPANAQLTRVEELLWVKGVTPELLWGLDQNRNFGVEPIEAATVVLPGVSSSDGAIQGGWASMITLRSAEQNLDSDGQPRVNVNQSDLETLHGEVEAALGEDAANFVIAYRQGGADTSSAAGGASGSASGTAGQSGSGQSGSGQGGGQSQVSQIKDASAILLDFSQPAAVEVQSLLDLVGRRAKVVEKNQASGQTLVNCPWGNGEEGQSPNPELLRQLFDKLTTTDTPTIPGRLNVNQAPRRLLAAVPGMPPGAADAIVGARDPASGSARTDRLVVTWLLSEGLLSLDDMRVVEPFLCAQGHVWRAQAVGAFEAGGPAARLEVVIDASAPPPVVRERSDLTPLGPGIAPELLLPRAGAPAPVPSGS